MKHAALVLFLSAALPAVAAEKYELKMKLDPDVGKTVTVATKSDLKMSIKAIAPDGTVLVDEKENSSEDVMYSETTREKKGDRGSRFTRVYMTAKDTDNGTAKNRPYAGRTVEFDREGEDNRVTVSGVELSKEQLDELISDLSERFGGNADDFLLPEKPVAVGESWTVDVEPLVNELEAGDDFDVEKSSGTAKLSRIYSRDGKRFGVIDADINLVTNAIGEMNLDKPTPLEFHISMDGALDGSSTQRSTKASGTLPAVMKIDRDGVSFTMQLNLAIELDERYTAETAKVVEKKKK